MTVTPVARPPRLPLFWRIVLYGVSYFVLQVLCLLVATLLATGLVGVIGAFAGGAVGELAFSAALVCGTLLLTHWFRRHVDRRSWRAIALPSLSRGWRQLLLGLVLGAATMGLLFLVEYVAGWLQITGSDIVDTGVAATVVSLGLGLLGANALAPGFTEEVVFRGYMFQNLGRDFPIWGAVVIIELLFGPFHVIPALRNGFDLPFVLSFFVTAVLFTLLVVLLRLITGLLWLPIGFHIGFNWFETNIFGLNLPKHSLLHVTFTGLAVLVGGPPFPTESGLVCMLVLLGTIVLAAAWLRRRGRFPVTGDRLDDDGAVMTHSALPSTVGA